jgi:hypothetical protein
MTAVWATGPDASNGRREVPRVLAKLGRGSITVGTQSLLGSVYGFGKLTETALTQTIV